MSSQKKSSTKVRAKKAAPTGQRQFSNLLRSQKAALVKDNMKPNKDFAYIAQNKTMVSKPSANPHLCRTGPKSELLLTIPSSSGSSFTVIKRIRINPLSRDTFKWLPQIAQNFESFKFHKLVVRYENRCSSTTSGSIILSPSYDAADSSAQAATEALLYENKGTKDFSVWKSEAMHLSVGAMNRLYKHHTCMSDDRFDNTKQDLKTIDPAQVFICIDGVNTGNNTGKIFLDYDCEFFEPHAPTEAPNQGGQVQDFGVVLANSTLPLTSLPTAVAQETSPIMKSLTRLVTEGVLPSPSGSEPTAVMGQLLKDYAGVLIVETLGTNITGTGSAYLSDSSVGVLGQPGDVDLGGIGSAIINAAATRAIHSYHLPDGIALAGKFLKISTGPATTITGLASLLAATSVV